MHSNPLPKLAVHCAATVALLAIAAACGGSDEPQQVAAEPPAAIVAPLIHDDGSLALSDPRAVPADAAAWTSNGLYATAAQARMLTAALGEGVLRVEVACCRVTAVDEAAGIAWGLQAAHSLPADTPVLVSGLDLRLAAATARRLTEGGLTHVWLVTP